MLALDSDGRLVVIELKRGDTGGHMDLQAIRYAAMVANMTDDQVVRTFQSYLERRPGKQDSNNLEGAAEDQLQSHLEMPGGQRLTIKTDVPRIILASENFGTELTTCVLWLNDSWLTATGIDIKCVQLQPYRNGDELLVESTTLIPLPEASKYRTAIAERESAARLQPSGGSRRTPGAEAFKEQIAKSQERFQPGLLKLYNAALSLEHDGLAELFTSRNGPGNYYRIELQVAGETHSLVTFNLLHFAQGVGEISVWPGLGEWAPAALARMDEVIGSVTSASGVRHRRLSMRKTSSALDRILEVIHDAYREAHEGHLGGGTGENDS